MNDAQDHKAALRRRIAELRSALTPEDRALRSRQAQAHVVSLDVFRTATCLGLYRPMGKEVATGEIAQAAWTLGKRVVVPDLQDDRIQLVSVGPATRFVTNALGFEVPEEGAQVALEELDLLVLPGLAFDSQGNRLGRGRGHYDRLLATAPSRLTTVGLGYAFQRVVERLPAEAHDRPLRWVVTEDGAEAVAP